MSQQITVSNGSQFFRIPSTDLPTAASKGFYRPFEKSKTIVSDGARVFEIPLADISAAKADGFRDVLAIENGRLAGHALKVVQKASAPATVSPSVDSETTILSEFQSAENELLAEEADLQRELEEARGIRKLGAWLNYWWFHQQQGVLRHLRGSGVSVAIHLAVFLILASLLLVNEKKDPPGLVVVASAEEDAFEEDFLEPLEMEVEEPVEEEVEPLMEQPEIVTEVTEEIVATDLAEALTGDLLAMPEPSGAKSDGDGKEASEKPTKAKVKFFGSKTEAVDFVFVIDNSNSMTRGRFETALDELVKAVFQLNAKQKFYVIFYSDTAYPLFYPYKVAALQPATSRNKQLLIEWLKTVQLCLQTRGKEALELGFSLDPDVMFVLGDGAFTDKASQYFCENPRKNVVVHTLGMEVDKKNSVGFAKLAKMHKGTYRDVGVNPLGAQMAKQFPRKKNNSRNGIWGVKLPAVPKKKK